MPFSVSMAVFGQLGDEKPHVREKITFLFNNDVLSDVSFVIRSSCGENDAKRSKMVIPAHKFVLSIYSPVFYAMFCGEMAEKSNTIDLPDCEYEGILEMLRYMYISEVELRASNVLQVLYVAKKYILPSLSQKCVVFLMRNLDLANVLCVLSEAQKYDEQNLVDRCWEMIESQTEEVVKSEEFVKIDRSLLEAMVKRATLTIPEVELFRAVDFWATEECKRQEVLVSGKVKRRILGEQIVKNIHFPVMEEKDFTSTVIDSNILTKTEVGELMRNFNGTLSKSVGFPEDQRVDFRWSCSRFTSFSSCSCEPEDWSYDGDSDSLTLDAIVLQVDKDIMLRGIRFFGCLINTNYLVSLKIIDKKNGTKILSLKDMSFSSVSLPYREEEISGYDVVFEPVVLRKNADYVVKSLTDGPETCFGCDGVNIIQSHGVTFTFKDYKSTNRENENETDVHYGQFSSFFFKPL